jgi:hypothetical protein
MKNILTLAFAIMLSSSIVMAQNNAALVDQVGSDNTGTIAQSGSANVADTKQIGDGNDATITQVGSNLHANTIYGSGEAGRGPWGIYQLGDENIGSISQEGVGVRASIIQEGDGNSASIDQDGTAPLGGYVYQYGDDNTASLNQQGKWASAQIEARGDGNTASIEQISTGGQNATRSDVSVFTSGSDNVITGSQEGRSNDAGRGGDYGVEQIGDLNTAEFEQDGMSLTMRIGQFGDSNVAMVAQTGSAHTAAVSQAGDGNAATITQSN